MQNKTLYDVYIASGWFNQFQSKDLQNIKSALDKLGFKYFSPKDDCLLENSASLEQQKSVFDNNLIAINNSQFLIVNTRDKDLGTIFECGYSYAKNKKIIYYCEGLVGNFNVMLSQSGIGVCTSVDDLESFLTILKNNRNYKRQYNGRIE